MFIRKCHILLIFCIVTELTTCTPVFRPGLKKEACRPVCNTELTSFFPENSTILYKTRIKAPGGRLSGILAIKTFPGSSCRMILMSEVGIRFFDFEFKGQNASEFIVHQAMPGFDRKTLMQTLEMNFRLLALPGLCDSAGIFRQRKGTFIYYNIPCEKFSAWYRKDAPDGLVTKIFYTGKFRKKVKMILQDHKQGVPSVIRFSCGRLILRIELTRIPHYKNGLPER
ncbi:MAG: hypothetical protein KJ607_14090 [Bacteroidetes bacterium]|nr:hypothetical protein [Bacteroidota bacterium]